MIKKLGHISIALLLLISTTGMTVRLHYCNNKLYDFNIFSQAQNCCSNGSDHLNSGESRDTRKHEAQSCHMDNHKTNDCKDDAIHVNSVSNFVQSNFQFEFNNLSFLSLFLSTPVVFDIYNQLNTSVVEVFYKNISPPDIHVILSFLQTYLL